MLLRIEAHQPAIEGDVAGYVSLDVDDVGFENPFDGVQYDQIDPLGYRYVTSGTDLI